ncbi:MAG TPA: hypothetical protein VF593_12520 [Chthoniobacteraceae bacterium]|jgi:hypothetical protein
MKAGFKDYLRAAFNAKPLGMFVPPNWVALGAFGLLGLIDPGFWLLGAGLELGYLQWLTSSARFRRYVESTLQSTSHREWESRLSEHVGRLSPGDAQRFRTLESRCRAVLGRSAGGEPPPEQTLQAEGLGRLLWIYLGLLQTRQSLLNVLNDGGSEMADKLRRLEKQLQTASDENLRASLSGQIDILRQRMTVQKEGRSKIGFLDAELARIEEQVELIREQSVLATDPAAVSRRIDEVGSSLGETTQWIRDQQKIYGEVQDLLEDPPAIPLQQSQ